MKFTRVRLAVILDVEDEGLKITEVELDKLGTYLEEDWLANASFVSATPKIVSSRQIELDEDDNEVR